MFASKNLRLFISFKGEVEFFQYEFYRSFSLKINVVCRTIQHDLCYMSIIIMLFTDDTIQKENTKKF